MSILTSEQFYDQSPLGRARHLSREVDFGVMWREGLTRFPVYRVTWVEATGEVYAETGGVITEILGVVRDEADLERRLAGWAEACTEPDGLAWVRGRLA